MRLALRSAVAVLCISAAGCGDHGAGPGPQPVALEIVDALPASAIVGSVSPLTVRLIDAEGNPVAGRVVSFAVTQGGGSATPAAVTTEADGIASTSVRLATVPGANAVTASAARVDLLRMSTTGTVGPPSSVVLSQTLLRLPPSVDSVIVTGVARDAFDNAVSTSLDWTVSDPTLLEVAPRATGGIVLRVLRRPGASRLAATSGDASVSITVAVQDGSSPCAFVAEPNELAPGATLSFEDDGITCVRAAGTGAEYVAVMHHSSPVANAAWTLGLVGSGVTSPVPALVAGLPPMQRATTLRHDARFEVRLRGIERAELRERANGARRWRRDANLSPPPVPLPVVGDLKELNVSPVDFCANPEVRTFRTMAVSPSVVLLADLTNPAGDFSEEEYQAIAAEIDTLVLPVVIEAFGAPTDLDFNSRISLLFTRRVNQLPAPGIASRVLGFFFARDLLPTSGTAACAGSNFGEMMYLLAPDPQGTVSGEPLSNEFVRRASISTVAHEMQHLINASRRLYITTAAQPSEETWLDEGLAHIAEELVFHRAAGSTPRQNIGGTELSVGSAHRAAFDAYLRPNFERYRAHLQAPDATSPLAANDHLGSRGAAWSFLRYVADHTRSEDGDFWRRLVSSPNTGVSNLDAALEGTGLSTLTALHRWSLSVFTDDVAPPESVSVHQPSWNFRSAMTELGGPLDFALAPRTLLEGVTALAGLINGGSSYVRFAVAKDQEALIRVSGSGAVPPGVHLTIMRIK